jgi:hypothetical protein
MPTHAERLENYDKVRAKIAEIGEDGLAKIINEAAQVHQGIGGSAVKFEIDGVQIFAKKIALFRIFLISN